MSVFMWDGGKWFWLRTPTAKPVPMSESTIAALFHGDLENVRLAAVLMSEPQPNRASVEIQAALMSRVRG